MLIASILAAAPLHRDEKLFSIKRTQRAAASATRGELPFGTDPQMYAWAAASAAAADEEAARAASGSPRPPVHCGRRNATQPTAVITAFLLGGKNAHGGAFGKQKAANLFKLTKAMLGRSSGLCAPGVSLHVVHDTPPEQLMPLRPAASDCVFVSHDASPTASPTTPDDAAAASGSTQGDVARLLQSGGTAAARAAARLDAATAPPGRVTYHYFSRLAQLPPDVRR